MSAPESRQVKRPRLSLSCIVCRRRKVRCGREKPECTNCIRMNETCVYEAMVRDELTGRVRQISPSSKDMRTGREVGSLSHPTHSHQLREDGSSSSRNLSSTDPSPAWSPQHRQPVDSAHLTVPSWEEATQGPGSGCSVRPGDPSDQRSSRNHGDILSSNYLSLRRGARVRYIGKAFWGFVAGQERLSDDFFDENRHASPGLPLPHISAVGLANILRSLPTKPVCDALLHAFFTSVWPLSPLVHTPTLQAEYDEFWEWCRNSDSVMPSAKLLDDPTFISLLFAVLYCGASAAPAAIWASANLQNLRKETTVNHLKSAYMTSLSMSRHLEHPTLNTLVSTLLTGPFMDLPRESMRNLVSVSTTVRIAQRMGLHNEGVWSALDLVTREMRRRVWWHIVWLDVQSSISTGLPLCCGSEICEAVSMVAGTRDEEIRNLSAPSLPPAESSTSAQSVAMNYAIGRFETARLESRIIARLQSGQGLTHEGFRELVTATKQLHQKIEILIAKVTTQGIPEKGFIPSRLANASPFTHPSLYKDDASQPTVFAAWTRIMLTLFKFDAVILLQKPFLQPPECKKPQARKSWTSIVQLCVSYLRNYLQLYRVPAFAPYVWSCSSYYGPLQCAFLILIYLHYFRGSANVQLARYCVDEVIDLCVSQYQSPASPSTRASPDHSEPRAEARMPLAIQVLIDLHNRLDSPPGINEPLPPPMDLSPSQFRLPANHIAPKANDSGPRSNQTDSSSITARKDHDSDSVTTRPPKVPATSKAGEPNTVFNTEIDSAPDLDFLASISDLEAWSSLLVMESEDFLKNPGDDLAEW